MMIGAGIGQYFLAKKIKERGFYLIVVTMPGSYPVIDIADKVCYVNVFEKDAVLAVAKENEIDAVISDQNDTMMPTVAYVAEHMGLPGNNTNIVDSYCNKNTFRDNCDKLGIPVPKHYAITDIDMPSEVMSWGFPLMIKPADSQSSLGVSKVNNKDEYFIALKSALEISKTRSAIIEEFFVGQELVAEGFIYKGKYYNIGFADRKYFDLKDIFIPSQTIFPSIVPNNVLETITGYECAMAEYIEPEFAIVHSEYLYNPESGKIKVVESALRGGGVYISSHLIPLYSSIDVNNVLIDCAFGQKIDIEGIISSKKPCAAAYICFYLPIGKVQSISGIEELRNMSFVHKMDITNITLGMESAPLTHKGQRLGPIIVSGDSRDDIDKKIFKIQNVLHILTISNDNIIRDINWK